MNTEVGAAGLHRYTSKISDWTPKPCRTKATRSRRYVLVAGLVIFLVYVREGMAKSWPEEKSEQVWPAKFVDPRTLPEKIRRLRRITPRMAAAAEDEYARVIRAQVKHVLSETHLKCGAPLLRGHVNALISCRVGKRKQGKVRDIYDLESSLVRTRAFPQHLSL